MVLKVYRVIGFFLVKICYDVLNFISNLFCDKPHSYFLLVHEFNALKAKSNLTYMHLVLPRSKHTPL
jgi:hypothetical protein